MNQLCTMPSPKRGEHRVESQKHSATSSLDDWAIITGRPLDQQLIDNVNDAVLCLNVCFLDERSR